MNGPALNGTIHLFVAFDWGDEIDLERARQLLPAAAQQDLPRRRRTPLSFSYRPAPLYLALAATHLEVAGWGSPECSAGLTLFDFGAVSLSIRIPFQCDRAELLRRAAVFADPQSIVKQARDLVIAHFQQLQPAIQDPQWHERWSEDYIVFQLTPELIASASDSAWLAGLVHLEAGILSSEEIAEAVRLRLTYSPDDLFVPDWSAAVLIDRECDETLQAIEFANLQLLEFRHIDNRLDDNLAAASREVRVRNWSRFWRWHAQPLRRLGELKLEANDLFERTGNVLKLVGDPYLARVYRLVSQRFHLESWEHEIERKLEVLEGIYQVVSDQASEFRTEFLELIVVILIMIEIILAFVH